MQKSNEFDLRTLMEVMKNTEGCSIEEKRENVMSNPAMSHHQQQHKELDHGTALQTFLDHIPVSSIPGIHNSTVVELKHGKSVKDTINLLYEKNVFAAPIADDFVRPFGRYSDQYLGFIDFARIVLWSIEECEKSHTQARYSGAEESCASSIFSMLEHNSQIGETKVGELAKSFLWHPFFPVRLDDTLFRVLLLLSKHHLQVVPVIEKSTFQAIGFVTQGAVIQLLLKSSGLQWFDHIADKALSEFRFESVEHIVLVYGDQSLAEALHKLWESPTGAVAVVNRRTRQMIGCIRNSDVYLLLRKNNDFVRHRKTLTAEEFIHIETANEASDPTVEQDLGTLLSAANLRLRDNFLPRMDMPVTMRRSNTLKQAMGRLADTKSSCGFLVDDSQQPTGILTLRDIIGQFAPPCIDAAIHGGGFFDSALEQTGCHVKNGAMIQDHLSIQF